MVYGIFENKFLCPFFSSTVYLYFYQVQKSDEFILNRIKWKIARYNISEGYIFFFSELTDEKKRYLLNNIDKTLSGIPVLFFTKPSTEWTLVCTKQVIGYHDQKIFKLSFDEIARIQGIQFTKKKSEWNELTIFDKQNSEYILHTNKGQDHFTLHNILLMLWRFTD